MDNSGKFPNQVGVGSWLYRLYLSKVIEQTTGIPASLRRRREYAEPTLFSYGFRPFFLGGALWAGLGIMLWLPQYFGELT
jgi:hypothetical protein